MRFHLLAAASTVALLGCSHARTLTAAPAHEGRLVLQSQSQFVSAWVTKTGIESPQVNLTRTSDGLRGAMLSRPVDLTITPSVVAGVVGTQPVKLDIRHESGALHALGLYAGAPVDFTANARVIQGTFGKCSYDLRFLGGVYQGMRNCGGIPEYLTVEIPESLARRGDSEIAASLGLFL